MPKNSDTQKIAEIILKSEQCGSTIHCRVMSLKDADEMTNSVDPDRKTAPLGESDHGLHSLPIEICPKT